MRACAIRFAWVLLFWTVLASAAERSQNFDTDPGWDESNNRIVPRERPYVTQDFGYSESHFAGRGQGEAGGQIQRASEPAFYAARIRPRTLNDELSASGSFSITKTSGGSGMFFGFFKAEQPGASGRPVNSLGLDFDCEGSGARLAVRLITAQNQSCGTFITPFIPGRFRPTSLRNDGSRYQWTLRYDPKAADGLGQFTFTLNGETHRADEFGVATLPEAHKAEARIRFPRETTFTVDLPKGFKAQGTTFDHFGMMNMIKPGGPLSIYFDDLAYLGRREEFSRDPKWDASGNRATYQPEDVAEAQNFGFSKTRLAGGRNSGELGGTFWRTEGPVAYYADRTGKLSLDDPLTAHGKLAFPNASPDSGMLIGWFNSATVDQEHGLKDFVGVRVEGPTRVGHYFAPVVASTDGVIGKLERAPLLVPGKKAREWAIEYDPKANGGNGAVLVRLDGESATLNLKPRVNRNATFDRFGVFTLRAGGSQVKLYLDDLLYTVAKAP